MSKSKTKTTTATTSNNTSAGTTTQNSTSTPTVAPWLSGSYQGFGSLIDNYATKDPTQLVAGSSDLQDKAFSGAGNLGGWQNYLNQAGQTATNAAGGPNTAEAVATPELNREDYTNPYINDVVNTTLAGFDRQAGMDQAALQAQAAKNRAFGGSRYGIQAAEQTAVSNMNRAAQEAALRSAGYDRATAAMESARAAKQADAARLQQANQFNAGQADTANARQLAVAQLLAGLGTASGDQSRADVATQLGAGEAQRDIEQDKLNALPQWLQQIGALYGSIPVSAFTSVNQTGTGTANNTSSGTSNSNSTSVTSDPLGALSGLLSGAGALASGAGAFKFG